MYKYNEKSEQYLANLRNFVEERYNGELLSSQWKGYKKALYKFRDSLGTEFEQTAENILHKKLWTPNRGLLSEPITRQVVEYIFQNKFEKNTSLLTKEITGLSCKYLELDGYNQDLKIAFEYQGFPSHWNKNAPDYEKTKERDILKKEIIDKRLKKLDILTKCFGYTLINKKWQGIEHCYIFLSQENKYYAINYQWINKFGFPDKNKIERFKISVKEISKYINHIL